VTVCINGQKVSFESGTTVADFLRQKQINQETVVIEYNGSILPRESFGETVLKEQDALEVLRFVGGG
jgi:sulfur carrier protein